MSVFIEDRDRQVVPRWRSFTAASDFGELRPLKLRRPNTFNKRMLRDVLEDWRREPSLSVAADVVSAAFTIGCTDAARDAAGFVLSHKNATPAAREIAQRCVAEADTRPSLALVQKYELQYSEIRNAIHQSRERLAEYPINPVLWTNLSLFFTTIGLQRKAAHAMRVALTLAPDNRFVVRAASRLYLHLGDIERAHHVLQQTAANQSDPWILAGEVAVAAIRQRSSSFVKRARRMVESQNHSPFSLSELTGALATMQARDGNLKKAKRLCRLSIAEPAENAIAQIAWLSRNVGGITWEPFPSASVQSSEANAWEASRVGNWKLALSEANQWQEQQPFSSRPAVLGSYVASTALEDFGEAERILQQGFLSNRNDAILCNNLGFVLAKQGKVVEAKKSLEQGLRMAESEFEHVCLTATRGLVAFRSGDSELGRKCYRKAISMASSEPLKPLGHIATIYLAIEELRIGSRSAESLRRQGFAAADALPGPLRPVFRDKLEKAKFSPPSESS